MPVMKTLFLNFRRSGLAAFVAAVVLLLLAPVPVSAEPGASSWVKTEQTALRLIAATETTGAAETLKLGLHFKLKPGWKIYWRSPGDAGFPPSVDWSRSDNLKSAVMHWPAPERFSVIGLETLGYKKEVVLPITVTREDTSKPLHLSGALRYLVCDEICIPYDADIALNMAQGPVRPSPFAHLISRFQSNVPGDGNRHGVAIETAETWGQGEAIMLRVRVTATAPFQTPDIYPEGPRSLTFAKPTVRLGPDGLSATLDLRVFGAQYLEGADKSLAGKPLTFTLVDGMRSAEKRLTVAPATGPPPFDIGADGATNGGSTPLALILVFALLGGLILNLMPCVLPVLSIKLLGVVGHGGGERRLVRLSFLASAAGILFAFLGLAGVLIMLKSSGMAIGWGIQFQQPWFLIAMTLLVTAFALNLWGAFEVRLPLWISDLGEHASHVHGLGGHFLQGAFATLLATPCSAPFLGTAVGFALARGGGEITAVFAALGLGLALPYLGVAAFPGLATRLPKPGPWMVTLRRFLGLALIATGVWLLSVLTTSAGIKVAVLVGVLTAAAAGLLALARLKRPGSGRRAAIGISAAVIAAFLAPGWLGSVTPGTASAKLIGKAGSSTDALGKLWRPFDEAAIPGLIAQGKTVFVDVTAEWCITCQINKALVLNQDEVLSALQGKDAVVMQADWTRPDPVISGYLARYQRYGIPFDAVYGPGAPKGVVLPELLSKDAVLDAFNRAAGPARVSSAKAPDGAKPKTGGTP